MLGWSVGNWKGQLAKHDVRFPRLPGLSPGITSAASALVLSKGRDVAGGLPAVRRHLDHADADAPHIAVRKEEPRSQGNPLLEQVVLV
jgi:hypothetical protein